MRALVIAIVLATAGVAAATPAQDLDRARDAFGKSEYLNAIPVLSSLLYPSPRLSRVDDLVEAHVLLAACAFETNDRATAAREFEQALALQPDLALDTGQSFSAAAIELFNERKEEIARRNREEAEKAKLAAERDAYQRMLASLVVVEKRKYYVNFLPFGSGQFQNGQRRKGIAFAASEALTGGVSAGIWLYLVGTYGVTGGKVPAGSADSVRLLEQVEIGTGVVCIGLIGWGIVDALINYKPSFVRKPDESALPPELREKLHPRPTHDDNAPPPGPPLVAPPEHSTGPGSIRFTPTPLPGGAGVFLTWTF